MRGLGMMMVMLARVRGIHRSAILYVGWKDVSRQRGHIILTLTLVV